MGVMLPIRNLIIWSPFCLQLTGLQYAAPFIVRLSATKNIIKIWRHHIGYDDGTILFVILKSKVLTIDIFFINLYFSNLYLMLLQ